jgi:hypothetical protein
MPTTYAALRRFALSLPEVTEAPHFHFGSFRVRGRIFITVPPGQQHVHLFVAEAQREQALAMHPECVEKLLWGGKVVGVRVALAAAAPAVLERLAQQAWTLKAPKSLARANADAVAAALAQPARRERPTRQC